MYPAPPVTRMRLYDFIAHHCKLQRDSGYAEISPSEERANATNRRMDIREQLAILRQKIEGIDARFASDTLPARPFPPPARQEAAGALIEDLVSGEVVTTAHGSHFETERHFPLHHRHGSYEISELAGLSPGLLAALSGGAIDGIPPERWLFLDTETTGLAGGSGTYAFLVGAGSIGPDGFRVRQFFMRDYSEEASLLDSLTSYME